MLISTDQLEAAAITARAFCGRDTAALAEAELLAALDAASRAQRASTVLLAQLSGEVALRSAPEVGMGLAKQQGFGSAPQFVANLTGGSLGDARRLVEAGAELCGPLPSPSDPPTPLAQAIASNAISVEAGALIRKTLQEMRAESPALDTSDVELRLVRKAPTVTLNELRRICLRERARHDIAAWERREKRQYDARYASITTDLDGMMVLNAKLDPASMAPVKTWFDAYVGAAFQRRRDAGQPDERSPGQIRADGLLDLANHALGCSAPVTGVKTTVVVRMTLEQLESKLGLVDCDGIDTPTSASTARVMLADAQVIPVVLGANSTPLDLGRTTRLFTPEQKIALGERDGGCAWCLAPPGWCDAHHIRWWERDRGPTDISNGVLLCRSCHMRVHNTGWTIRVERNRVWFDPPPGEGKVPVLGGRARLEC